MSKIFGSKNLHQRAEKGIFLCNYNEVVKSQTSDGTVKSSRCKACKSEGMRRTYMYAAMIEDAAERRRWTFYEAVNY